MSLGMTFGLHPYTSQGCNTKSNYFYSLEKSCFFIPRAQATESPTSVSGQFCISLHQNVNIKSIKVRLRGTLTM